MILRPLLLAVAGVVASANQASAHAHLKSATPPINGVVSTAPSELDLAFSEGLDLKFTGVCVTGPGKTPVTTGPAAPGTGGDATLVVPLPGTLAGGTYAVTWHALSTDGHKTSGKYTFTIKP